MSLLTQYLNKTLSVFRMGQGWFNQLCASLFEAGRTISYIETVQPRKSDTLHKDIKLTDISLFRREFEKILRKSLKKQKFKQVKVAIDATEDPYWGKCGLGNTRPSSHDKHEKCWQYVNLSIVEPYFFPLMSLPYRQIDNLDNLVIDLLEYLKSLNLKVGCVLFDRGFYHWRLIDYLENKKGEKPLPYIIFVPKNKAMKKFFKATNSKIATFEHQGIFSRDKSKWQPSTRIVVCKDVGKDKNGKPYDWCFATNLKQSFKLISVYRKRWNIETGFRIHDETRIKSKSSNLTIRYFYHMIGMLIVIIWRLFNRFVRYEVFKRFLKIMEYEHILVHPKK